MDYFLEAWSRGFVKDQFRKFSSQNPESYHPHITFARPFDVKGNEEEVLREITRFCIGKDPIMYVLDGEHPTKLEWAGGNALVIPVVEGESLLEFNNGLERAIGNYVVFKDKIEDEKRLHATLDYGREIDERVKLPRISQWMLRLTLIKRGLIRYSYDFVTQEVLNREESLDEEGWKKTVELFVYHLI